MQRLRELVGRAKEVDNRITLANPCRMQSTNLDNETDRHDGRCERAIVLGSQLGKEKVGVGEVKEERKGIGTVSSRRESKSM